MECDGFSHPFEVRYFTPFPEELYEDVIDNLPKDEFYKDLPHQDAPLGSRKVFIIDQNASVFWRELSATLRNESVEALFKEHLGFIGAATAVVRLFRDFSGYKIAPHPDSSKKLCTVQFYLPKNDRQAELGTSFYSRTSDGAFFEEYKLQFLPNTGYCFKVSDTSWHGCDFKILEEPRNTLILTYYKAKG